MILDVEKLGNNDVIGTWLWGLAAGAAPMLGATLEFAGKIDPTEWPFVSSFFLFIKSISLFLYIFLVFIYILGRWLAKKGDRFFWLALQVQLDDLQKISFPHADDDYIDNHRVTLFKYKKVCYEKHGWWNLVNWYKSSKQGKSPRGGWLIPILRSNHLSKNTKVVFCAPDNSENCEGFAGESWCKDNIVYVDKLPTISKVASEQNIEKYALRTNISARALKEKINDSRRFSGSMMAIPLRTSSGVRWGVIVLDSTSKDGIERSKVEGAFLTIVGTLGVLLEKL